MATDANARLRITATDETRAAWDAAFNQARTGAARVSETVKGAFDKLGGLTGISIGLVGLGKVFKDAAEYADDLDRAASKVGLSVDKLSSLAFAAQQSDVAIDTLSGAINKLQLAVSSAEEGNKDFLSTFRSLGIDFQKFKSLSADQQFREVAEAISLLKKETDQTRGSVEIFGKSGAELLPFLKQGASGIAELEERAKDFGLAIGPDAVKRILEYDEALKKLTAQGKGLGLTLTEKLAPALGEVADGIRTIFGGATELEKLTAKLEFLQRMRGQAVINFGLLDGAGVFVTPAEVEQQIVKLTKSIADLQAQSGAKTVSVTGQGTGFSPLETLEVKAKKLGKDEFADSELAAVTGPFSAAERRAMSPKDTERQRSLEEQFAANRERYENQRKVLEDIDKSIAEGSTAIFEENEQKIAESLDRMEKESLESFETQKSLFEELFGDAQQQQQLLSASTEQFGRTIQSSLSDAFLDAGKGADKFADSVLNAFKKILADAAAQKTIQLISGLFGAGKKDPGVGGGSSGGAGIFGSIVGALFGGARAEGGSVDPGRAFLVGERGPELFMPRRAGTIVPNGAMAGGGTVINYAPVTNIDMRGSSNNEMATMLPAILKKNNEQQKNEIAQLIKRRQAPFA